MNLAGRLATLERRTTEAHVRAHAERLARAMDLPADEVYDRMTRALRIGFDAALRELAVELGVSVEEARREVEATHRQIVAALEQQP